MSDSDYPNTFNYEEFLSHRLTHLGHYSDEEAVEYIKNEKLIAKLQYDAYAAMEKDFT